MILRKIAAFPRQNALNKTLREIGRVERSLFMADWLMEPALRRRSNANLDKGESRHAPARAVFFHRLGELRDRTAETLAYRASGLNLVVNAIILWNTTYFARAVACVRSQGVPLMDADLARVAPIRWGHIALTGDHLWSELERPRERFRPLRTRRFDPARFAGPWRTILQRCSRNPEQAQAGGGGPRPARRRDRRGGVRVPRRGRHYPDGGRG